ncbi:putative lipid-binding transport protein (Tim44 family) [Azospirillum lipoferum]|uniref:Tim44 domain-containing protein n=1 Tax=Azospirillum lipoferum TaxID=193 RepID=A0A5A9G0E9_AZOLI|nr:MULTISPECIES: Tim44 domain-containing protein [Azospirillum]KAA0587990.1 Tim44 domain-containing protein [Azospirillum lipoferum]MCP1612164.1 putative lipid-binding transport protein (Tim44 family) [Azospirillum lipoferum]MDW5536614.1 Tim44 domain-containing protein [Azospirillum sp. NL1]
MSEKTRPSSLSATSSPKRGARAATAVAVALVMALAAGTADARAGKSTSSGSRGSRTTEAPAATSTAPNAVSPMERSTAPAASPGMQRPGAAATAPAAAPSRGFFGGGFMSGLMGGLIGAGIGAMLFGGGFFEGLGSFAGILGFLLQILLVVFLVRLAMRFFRNRSQTANTAAGGGPLGGNRPAYAGGPLGGQMNRDTADVGYNPVGGMGGGNAGPAQRRQAADEIGIQPADFESFERLLVTVQTAYGREDANALRAATTPEMFSYFSDDLAENRNRGVINKVSDVRLLQGDLAEGWREGAQDYATVAMRFSLIDVTEDRTSGRVIEGNASQPTEATELWTFVRPRGGQWQLSAIQQAH